MVIRLTPVHTQVLALVRDRQFTWWAPIGPFGGFAMADGSRIPPSLELVALYELRNAELISVDTVTGRVTITSVGMGHLAHQRPNNVRPPAEEMRSAS